MPQNLSEYLEIRVRATEKQAFRDAADSAGLSLSAWIRERLRRSAIHDLEEVGAIPMFLKNQQEG